MKDYRIEIKVRNNRIIEYMRQLGYNTVMSLARATGLSHTAIAELINLKRRPVTRHGYWSKTALGLCEALCCHPTDLWTDAQREACLKKNFTAVKVAEKELSSFLESPDPLKLLEHKQTGERIRMVLGTLPDLQADILKMRFGLDPYFREYTLEEIAQKYNLTRERIRQRESRALRMIRNSPTRQRKILEAMPYKGINRTEIEEPNSQEV